MTDVQWAALKKHQDTLIRKALDGSVFVAPIGSAAITALTGTTDQLLMPLPTGYADVGYLTSDGVTFGKNVSTNDVTSWGNVEPTRSDITSQVTTLQATLQETNLQSLQLYTGANLASVTATSGSGEISIAEATQPNTTYYRALVISVDEADAGEIYVARFLPRAKVTAIADQKQSAGGETQYGLTLTGYKDDALGYSVRHFFGGVGWKALLVNMGFPAST